MNEDLDALTDHFLALNPQLERSAVIDAVNRTVKYPAATRRYIELLDASTQLPVTAPDRVQALIRALIQIGLEVPRLPTCPRCFEDRRVAHVLQDGTRACNRCWNRERVRICDGCGSLRQTYRKVNDAMLCRPCVDPKPIRSCVRCGRSGVAFGNVHGRKVCLNCIPKKPLPCTRCGKVRPAAARMLGGVVCHSCYHSIRRKPRVCASCGEYRILANRNSKGAYVCAECAGVPVRYSCIECGSEDHFLGGKCARCRNVDILDDALGNPPRDPALAVLRRHLLEMHPQALHKWLTRSPAQAHFRMIVATPPPRSVSLLDDAPRGLAITHLRELLFLSGVLEGAVDSWLHTYDRAVAELLEGASPEARQALTIYSRWTVRPKLVRSAMRRPIGEPQYSNARAQIAGALRFIRWLEDRGTLLADMDQSALDEFTSTQAHHGWIGNFVRWIGKTYGKSFDFYSPIKQAHFPRISDERRFEVARRLLMDDDVPLDIKATTLLVATLGVNITTAVAVRRDAVRFLGPGAAWLSIDERESVLPQWLARLFWEQAIGTPAGDWLFPGRMPGNHLGPASHRRYLSKYELTLRDLQIAARFQLAASMNPVMLANSIGLTPATMLTYRALSGGSWSDAPMLFGKPSGDPQ